MDLGKGVKKEAHLVRLKVRAGADFLLTQPVYDAELAKEFLSYYQAAPGPGPKAPIFFGVQVLVEGGVIFSDVPTRVTDDLNKGRSGEEIALETIDTFREAGIANIYLVSPILKGGARDYGAARRVISALK